MAVPPFRSHQPGPEGPEHRPGGAWPSGRRLPLEGIRIIEMGQLIAIPYAMKMLADMGAQVIRLESCQRLENYRNTSLYENNVDGQFWNRGANFYEQNRNKLGVTLELDRPEGLAILKELVAISDVFAENYTPRVMKNFGLEHEDLRRIKPDIIMVSSTGYGYNGPWSSFGATGPATEAASSLAYMTGYRDGPPIMSEIPYTDYTAAEHTVFAVMAALLHRMRTGRGQFIDLSQAQTASATVPEALLDFAVNRRIEPRMGNEDPLMAPHGCYPCRGGPPAVPPSPGGTIGRPDEGWITIAVSSDDQWHALCQVLGRPEWSADARFSEQLTRWHHRAELDRLVAEATHDGDSHQLMHALQSVGVPAGAVLGSKDLLFDPHLRARRFYEVVSHHPSTGMPPLPYASRPWKLLGTPEAPAKAAPTLGEHNRWVICQLLGRPEEELMALEGDGVIGYAPRELRPVRPPPPEEQIRQGRMLRYEADFREQVVRGYGTVL